MPTTPDYDHPALLDRLRLLSLQNGERSAPTFSAEETTSRLARLRDRMRKASIDACLVTSIHNVNYFADYVYCPFGCGQSFGTL